MGIALYQVILLFAISVSSAIFLPNGCPSDVHSHLLLPHETDCDKFYQCSHGNKILMLCSGGLHFDVDLQVCNWPTAVNCRLPTETVTTTPYITSTILVTTESPVEKTTVDTENSVEKVTTEITIDSTTSSPNSDELDDASTETTTFLPNTTEDNENEEDKISEASYEITTNVSQEETTTGATFVTSSEEDNEEITTTEENIINTSTDETTDFDVPTTESIETAPEIIETTTYYVKTSPDPKTTTESIETIPEFIETTTGSFQTTTETTTEPIYTTILGIETTTAVVLCPVGVFGNVPHPELCDSFYMCAGGNAIQLFCSSGYEFDPEARTCVKIAAGGCTLGEVTTSTESVETTSTTTTEAIQTTTIVIDTTTAAEICPVGVFGNVPHPELCDSFYMCAGGNAIQLFCSSGYEFDPEARTCVKIAAGGCTLGEVTTSTESVETTSTTTTEAIQTTTIVIDTTTAAEICPVGVFGNVPHPELCDSFYMCAGGNAIQLFCSSGYEFDPEARTCVKIAAGGCTLGEVTTTTESVETTTEAIQTTTIVIDTTTAAEICPVGVFGNVPHPELCDSFYMCAGGNAIQLFCSSGYEFDPEARTCVKIAAGGCTLGEVTTTTESVETTTEAIQTTTIVIDTTTAAEICPVGVFGNVPHPELCDSFYMCAGGNAIQLFCSSGYEFDPEARTCVKIAAGGCTLGEVTTSTESVETTTEAIQTTTIVIDTTTAAEICPVGVFGNVPHPELCDSFYMCAGGNAIQLFCSSGYEFDPEARTCVKIAAGGCTLGEVTTSTESVETTSTTTTEAIQTTTIVIDTTTAAEICPVGVFGNVPHPELCDSFYMCAGGNAIQLFCSSGYEFDPEARTCIQIAEGGCTLGNTTRLRPEYYTKTVYKYLKMAASLLKDF